MATHYNGTPIKDLLAELETASHIFEQVDSESLDQQMFNKLCRGWTYIVINKAKLTAMQKEAK